VAAAAAQMVRSASVGRRASVPNIVSFFLLIVFSLVVFESSSSTVKLFLLHGNGVE